MDVPRLDQGIPVEVLNGKGAAERERTLNRAFEAATVIHEAVEDLCVEVRAHGGKALNNQQRTMLRTLGRTVNQ